MANSLIPIVVPTYKAPDKLEKCLGAIEAQTYPLTKVFVKDNSNDPILYTKAVNIGLRKFAYGDAEFILTLTDDAWMAPTCLEEMVKVMRSHPKCGIVGAVQMSDGQVTWGGSAAAWPGGQHTYSPDASEPFKTYWANFACVLLRTEMIREIGLLDENLLFVCSDSDYSFTARSRGWDIFVAPRAIVEHKLGETAAFGKNLYLDGVKLNDFMYFTKKWLSGGVYRELSFEGTDISNTQIRNQLNTWHQMALNVSKLQGDACQPQPE